MYNLVLPWLWLMLRMLHARFGDMIDHDWVQSLADDRLFCPDVDQA